MGVDDALDDDKTGRLLHVEAPAPRPRSLLVVEKKVLLGSK